ncbi:LysR family transcriptional regulator [Frankia sp. AgB32]|uniref:LysR family transcriptional regulator n=1 Tax=Frankia sp. AgB32 TaxID=631119 RepID=UPI00200C7DF1|nr:LysR family transcriptional regulator [Frankia sp. AgB32]MCK9896473.1 LysR family transcriptional regulator [Frankia sp. AgB32]
MDLAAVRTVVAVARTGQFQQAAAELAITQQAVSKRVAALEKDLGVRLFTRTPRGAELTIDGQAFLPHARELLRAADRALACVRPGHRALRVEVINRRIATATLLREFHGAHPDVELDVVTLAEAGTDTAVAAVRAGTIDAAFRAVGAPSTSAAAAVDGLWGVAVRRILDEPHQLLTGPWHPLAAARSVTPAQLVGHRLWIPGILPGTEWGAYYAELAAAFGLGIDAIGPNFGTEHLLDALADSATLATLVGAGTRLVWPAQHDLRRIPLRDPTPVYPHSVIWRRDNPHPALPALLRYLRDAAAPRPARPDGAVWTPTWAA